MVVLTVAEVAVHASRGERVIVLGALAMVAVVVVVVSSSSK